MNLTVIEKNAIARISPHLQEYVNAKFQGSYISSLSDYELEMKVKALILKTLFEAGIKDAKDDRVTTFLRETLSKDLRHHKFAKVSFGEIELALHKGVRQEYGPFMGVNIQTIHSWIRSYLNSKDKENAIKEFHAKLNQGDQPENRASKPNPEMQKRIIESLRQLVEDKKPSYIHKEKPPVQKSERDLFIQQCFKDFSELNKKGGIGLGERFIMFEGKEVDEAEYTQIRLTQYDKQIKEI